MPGLISLFVIKLSVFAVFLSLLGFLTLPRLENPLRRVAHILLTLSALAAGVGLFRFARAEALPGILQARSVAAERQAVSTLREIAVAQDMLRKYAFIDPDGDKIGSAGLLSELSGKQPFRHGAEPQPPVLHARYQNEVKTRHGIAARVGDQLYQVCLPLKGGGFTTQRSVDIDDELAERRFLAHSWPASNSSSSKRAFFIDEHLRILQSENQNSEGRLRHVGSQAPACEAGISGGSGGEWEPWQGKQARSDLPGDRP